MFAIFLGTAFGKGVYFGTEFHYSANPRYTPPDSQGFKYMFLCRVLVGDWVMGNAAYIEPPAKDRENLHLYDSVVDNVFKPTIFVIFHDAQAYPEYLITFV